LFSFTLSACNFSRLLERPAKTPADKKDGQTISNIVRDGKIVGYDTTEVHIGDRFQPTFTDARNNPKDLNYTVESVVFKNNKGLDINGWMIKPKNRTPDITLLFLHGNGGNIISHCPGALPLVEKGFQVFIIDYSGFGYSQGKATRKNAMADGAAALQYLYNRADVKNTRIVVYGQSMGAHFAPAIAASHQQWTDGMVIEGGFMSWKAVAAYHVVLGFVPRLFMKEDYSVAEALKTYRKPVLVIHSSEDKTVPISMGIKIFNTAGYPKSYLEIGKCHVCGPIYYSDKISEKIRAMVK